MKAEEKRNLRANLELVELVSETDHNQLGALLSLFSKYVRNNDNMYHQAFLHEVVSDTINPDDSKRYKPLSVNYVLDELNAVYCDYEDDIEFDLLTEFEKNM